MVMLMLTVLGSPGENYCAKGLYAGLATPGTYQQYLTSPAIYTSRIPDGVPDEVAGPIMCSASTMHRALIDSGLKPGNWVVFPGGSGGVGIQGVQLAKYVFAIGPKAPPANSSLEPWECDLSSLMVVRERKTLPRRWVPKSLSTLENIKIPLRGLSRLLMVSAPTVCWLPHIKRTKAG